MVILIPITEKLHLEEQADFRAAEQMLNNRIRIDENLQNGTDLDFTNTSSTLISTKVPGALFALKTRTLSDDTGRLPGLLSFQGPVPLLSGEDRASYTPRPSHRLQDWGGIRGKPLRNLSR